MGRLCANYVRSGCGTVPIRIMEQIKIQPSRLLLSTLVENRDDIDERFERSYQFVQNLTTGLGDKDAHDALNNALLKDKGYEDVSLGLLVTVLTEPQNASKAYRDLTLITRDGFGLILTNLSQLVLERYLRFNDITKSQLIWLVREMIKNSVTNVDNLCWNLMRHAAGGDTSPKNIALIEALLDVFIDYKGWLERIPVLLQAVVYTYLRLIDDHSATYLATLRQKEVTFLISLLRDKFIECIVIGRDLVRLLQNVARIPEFEQLWRDILAQPKQLSPSFNGILQLLQTRTSRRFLQSRLTPEMERKLVFLTSSVRFGHHKRYQEWFQRQYLSTPESQSLRCDMIRFIVGVIHPTNELLCSDIIPRWAVIGWLLTTCTSNVAVSNAKLALFYDWLFYDSEKDNIMNIEPAILVMHHSMRSHPAVSATLLDFLCRIINNFFPPLTDRVRAGIFSSLRQILDKRVLPSLLPLFDNAKLDRELRVMVRDTFKEFCASALESSSKRDEIKDDNHTNNHGLDEPAFSDEEEEHRNILAHAHPHEDDTDDDDIPLAKVRLKERTHTDDLDAPLRACVNRLQTEKTPDAMDALLQHVLAADVEMEQLPGIARRVCAVVEEDLPEQFLPINITDENLAESIRTPIFIIFRTLFELCKSEDAGKRIVATLLAEMYNLLPAIGYLLLYFLKVRTRLERAKEDQTKATTLRIHVYKELCHGMEKKLDVCLLDDTNACHLKDTRLLLWLIPDLFKDFKQQTVNNSQLLRVIVSVVDARQLQELIYAIVQGHLVLFKSDNLHNLVKSTLVWETIEQFFFWQLLQAHDIGFECVVGVIPHLDHRKHGEALTALTLMLSQEQPTADYIKHLFSRDIREDDEFTYSVIKCWCRNFIDAVGEFICNLINTRYPATSPNKRKRAGNKSLNTTTPSADQVLGHLDLIRSRFQQQDYVQFFYTDSLQKGLQVAQTNSSDSQRKQFCALFSLIEEEDVTVKSRTQGRGRKPGPKSKRALVKDVSDSSEHSSEEEEMVKPKQAKKRKKVVSDSE